MIIPDTDIKTVNKLIEQLGELPAAPIILNKVIKLTSDLQSNIEDITKNITADQILSAKVIRMSNSPAYGRASKITTVSEAIRVLGFNQVKSIIITASTAQMFHSDTQVEISKILWEHSLATALGARLIVKKFGGIDEEEAYLCGLLHDIGKLVLLKQAPNIYNDIINKVKETNLSFIVVEGKEFGFNHVNVCQALLRKWQFPTNLTTQISAHHATNPNRPETTKSLSRIVALSDSIAKYIGAGFIEAYNPDLEGALYFGSTLIEDDDLIELRTNTEEQFNIEMNSFL